MNDFNNRREITDTFVGNETISPIIDNFDVNATLFQNEDNYNLTNEFENMKLTASALSVSVLSDIPYKAYPTAKHSKESLGNFAGFGVNSYNGKVKNYNEDRIRVVASHVSQSKIDPNKKINISYFSIFDGHSGKKCSEFLKKQFYDYLINSSFFPDQPLKAINEAFKKAEAQFLKMAYDAKSKTLLDKSGSCAIILLIMDNILYAINLGDSRALYSYDTGRCLLQITRDHKPNDEVERKRIENAGGKIYYANTIKRNGKDEESSDITGINDGGVESTAKTGFYENKENNLNNVKVNNELKNDKGDNEENNEEKEEADNEEGNEEQEDNNIVMVNNEGTNTDE